ncbi:hypothetical protein CHLNCDRAFT_141866 [Chlorella variabilis]|uniref:Gamma-glutamyltransferase n=1 Tax=Chlorella variabilis TaxID=554065 RepID=E1Z781_CHLVA|nr:hypothetical protein CHLNCDRAFT_141866 [Chlorella variabilis]EFN58127.1 hypothetical protein CHLNCDRAFT_141866 [Chlorella variabilis]|eukprot:XP_005850229.1 hypothetical protein CHLNCDRAFT_141866 [Chlorella variabilis]
MAASGGDRFGVPTAFGSGIELTTVTSDDDQMWGAGKGLLENGQQTMLQRVRQRVSHRPLATILIGITGLLLLALVAAAAYSSGRHSVALGVTGCAGISQPTTPGDTVAPEGSISSSFEAQHDFRGRPRSVAARGGVVAADHGRCSDIGAEVLRDGGNAVDAAVATVLCQGIYNPMASGAGGGHFMLIRRAPCGAAKELQHATE